MNLSVAAPHFTMRMGKNQSWELLLQSGFGVNFILAWRILGKLPPNFATNFDGEFFNLVSPGFHPPPPPIKKHSREKL